MKLKCIVSAVIAGVAAISFADPILSAGDAATNTSTIQSALDAAGSGGTVELGEGVFEINRQLLLDNGVTLVGQGWEKTVIRQTVDDSNTSEDGRCVTVSGGAKLEKVTVTGGRINQSYANSGAGVKIADGTVSWCCVSNNVNKSGSPRGGGVLIVKGRIDHSVVAFNKCGDGRGAGIGGYWNMSGQTAGCVIDTCLIYGNSAYSGNNVTGSAIGFNGSSTITVEVRNCTVYGNTGKAKALVGNGKKEFKLFNTIVTGNTAGDVDALEMSDDSSNNVIGVDAGFVNAAGFDFRLTGSSTAKAVGTAYSGIGTDLDGKVFADPPSAGCYQYGGGLPPEEPDDPDADPVCTLTVPAKTGLVVSSVTTNGVAVSGVNGAYSIVSNTEVTITFAANSGYTITGGANPVVVTVESNLTLADAQYPTVQKNPAPEGLICPGETASETRETIQNAIDAAAPDGTVTLGDGLFLIDSQLMVTGGVTLVGQGYTNTVIRQTRTDKSVNARCATVDGGAKLEGVTLTGAEINQGYGNSGAGVRIVDGTVSWCCVSNNVNSNGSPRGGGVMLVKGVIDHSIVAFNRCGDGRGAGIGGQWDSGFEKAVIDTCLIYGNESEGHGGGIGFSGSDGTINVVIRNTTIAGNKAGAKGASKNGGGLYCERAIYEVVNTIVSGNSAATDPNVKTGTSGVLKASSSDNLIDEPNPGFVDAAHFDFHLDSGSPALESGKVYAELGVDLDGRDFDAERPAIGCYELGGTVAEKAGAVFMIW